MDRKQGRERERERGCVAAWVCSVPLPSKTRAGSARGGLGKTDHSLICLSKSKLSKSTPAFKSDLHTQNISSSAGTKQQGIYLNGRRATVVLWVTLQKQHSSITSDRGKIVLEAKEKKKKSNALLRDLYCISRPALPHSVHSVASIDLDESESGA